jgi:hypothetical protein
MVIQEILNEDIVSRSVYLKQIEGYLGSPLIKVLTGQRRV